MQKNDPLISIVTICYNLEKEIGKTIESVLKLDSQDFEYVIIDGNSKDGTLSIIKSYELKFLEKNISFSYHSENDKGIYDAMNKGVTRANGQWITILTGGDEFHPEFSLKKMFHDPKPDCIYFGKSISYYKSFEKIRYKNFHLDREEWYLDYMPNHQAVFIPASFCKNNEYNLDLNFSSDTHYLRKAFSSFEYSYSDQFVSLFQLGGVSNYYGSYKNFKKMLNDVKFVELGWTRRILSMTKHCVKYMTQCILGRERYLEFYIENILKED